MHVVSTAMARRRAITMFILVNSVAAAAFWATVIALGVNPVYSVVLFAPFSFLSARIAARKLSIAGIPWAPWKGLRQSRDTTDDVNPEISVLMRIVSIGYVAVTGVMLAAVAREIVRSVMKTSP